ncbi:hypothetical protein EG328_005141 [Venturia inaequalis]|uniref:Uncharacterized protein n=1 Tax=Venturia inaequalis TaxID=5025 RepID=A0A8H3UMY8_VENIN|nr:hypothetical protein EG328_005141 [Venturia inaequalis]KAE9982515.1 hypothetical protein EG327_005823 [Venturia inaequalis]
MRFTALSALAAVSTSILALPITPSGNSIILGDNTINRRNPEDDKTNTAELLFTPGLKLPGLKFADDDGNSVVITVVEAGGPEEYEELQGCR